MKSDKIKKYDLGLDAGINYTQKIYSRFDFFISPRIELGLIRFSYSNHLSYQLRAGLRYNL